ncbi:MAG: TlyA family rRNA (cytidine-2'-O)-methyltransferase [Phycisphaerae bacterium]|nr:TlyA family rRNA (cytidine-2'-O)-methyltransferase [Phycisphaerae bacterium]
MRARQQEGDFASRAGVKLAHALSVFDISVQDRVCADLGSSTGGFVDCLLRHGAARVYAVDRGYGLLAYALRQDTRVVVMERTDALHLRLPERVQVVTVDTGWTRQARILPAARRLLGDGERIVSLVKPHYEARPDMLRGGILPDDRMETVLAPIRGALGGLGLELVGEVESPIRGRGGNREFLWLLKEPSAPRPADEPRA